MSALQKAIKESFENEPSVVLNMKIIKGDRSGYVPSFWFFIWPIQCLYHHRHCIGNYRSLFGLLSVWYAKKNSIWVYPNGMISTSVFVYLLFKWALLGDMIINAYYFIMSAYGWYYWSKREEQVIVHPITLTTKRIQNGFAALWGEFTFYLLGLSSLWQMEGLDGLCGHLDHCHFFCWDGLDGPPKNRTLALLDCRGYHIHTPLFL